MSNYAKIRLNELKTKRYNLNQQKERICLEILKNEKKIYRIEKKIQKKKELKPWKNKKNWQLILLAFLIIFILIFGYWSGSEIGLNYFNCWYPN